MVALERAGIPVERYVAYEIEPNAIKISQKNYPQIEQCGDATTADFWQYKGFDLVIGGFPCQDLSINKANRKGLKGERSRLFYELARAIWEVQPKYFMVENNYKMPDADMRTISEILGVQPVLINSALFSAQQRKRLYWTNIPIKELPKSNSAVVADIVEQYDKENLIGEVKFNGKQNCCDRKSQPLRIGTIGKGGARRTSLFNLR